MAKAPAVKASTAVVSWKDKLKEHAQEAAASAATAAGGGVGFKISAKKGKLLYEGQPVAGNKLSVIILDGIFENAYYDTDFDADNLRSPVCFAFGRDEKTMAPHADSKEPQADTCAECAMNEYGSKGKGKACRNLRRLALLPASPLTAEAMTGAEAAYMKVPPTSTKAYDIYVKRMKDQFGLPPYGVVTELSVIDDDKTQHKVLVHNEALVVDHPDADSIMPALINRHEAQVSEIEFPYAPPPDLEEKPKPKGRGKF